MNSESVLSKDSSLMKKKSEIEFNQTLGKP